MGKSKVDKLTEQEAAVSNFLKEHRTLLKDPELSDTVLETIFVQGAELLKSVSDDMTRMKKTTVDAINSLTEALNKRPRVASKIARREKKYEHYIARFDRMEKAFNELESFVTEVKARRDGEELAPKLDVVQAKRRPVTRYVVGEIPWWKRLLGIHQEAPSEAPRSAREAPVTPSEAEGDNRDYEKYLGYYDQVLIHLESMVRMRAQDGDNYTPEQDQRWKAQWDTAVDNMAWADENMDAIEERNPEIVWDELGDRRRDLETRRTRLGQR